MALVSERLQEARRGLFVGREAERSLFQEALASPRPAFFVLFMHGLGGVGKTALLREFAAVCDQAGVRTALVDGRTIEPTPEAFAGALALALAPLGLEPDASGDPIDAIVRFLGESGGRYALMVDTYEMLWPLDQWLREAFLPQLPDSGLVVLAGRQPPSAPWHLDSGWQSLLRTMPLRNLSAAESLGYLLGRNVPAEQHQAVLEFTHGHPLALSLVADLFAQRSFGPRASGVFSPEGALDTVKVLVEHLVREVSSDRHRAALEACALAHLTTEPLLRQMLDLDGEGSSAEGTTARELFAWLRSLSLIEVGTGGVFPHDLAREALLADLRWRDPARYAELHRRARSYYSARLGQTSGRQQQEVLFDYVFLHRSNAVVRPFLEWRENGRLSSTRATPQDVPHLLGLVEKHEGAESARIAAHWLKRQPHSAQVIREPGGPIVGFLAAIALHEATPEDGQADPGARAALDYLNSHAPLRPGEAALMFRFWMAEDGYQQVSPAQSLIFIKIVQAYLTTPGLALTLLPCADAEFWAPISSYAGASVVEQAAFEVGGRRYTPYSHDWRAVPPMAWLDQMADRETSAPSDQADQLGPPPQTEQVIVLSRPDFEAAVTWALRHLLRPAELSRSPLLRSRLVASHLSGSPQASKAEALQEILQRACRKLQQAPRTQKLYLSLYHTYLHPAASQESAAEVLGVSLSTFRRHLKQGVARVAEDLWEQEVRSP